MFLFIIIVIILLRVMIVIVIIISIIVIISILFSNKRGIVFKIIRNQKRKKEFKEKLENKEAELGNLKINNLERGK